MRAIGRHAAIGDGRSVALISDEGSIDWLCWPRIDSPSLFSALLDEEAGSFRIAPLEPYVSEQRYLDDTNVVVTTMRTARGAIEVLDSMPVTDEADKVDWPEREIVRRVRCVRGEVDVEIAIEPRPGYGAVVVDARRFGELGIRWDTHEGALWLRSDLRLEIAGPRACARTRMTRGARLDLSLTFAVEGPATLPTLGPRVDERLAGTVAWWRAWSSRATYRGRDREQVVRSALALKLLCFAPSGAIVAAPTTSLPEQPGGALNWDYRFCWVRDASFTVHALVGLGYLEEADAFVGWLLHATRLTAPRLRVLYDVYGRPPPRERELALRGHFGARPVRVGNAAREQLQLDLPGEVIDATAQLVQHGRRLDRETQKLLSELGQHVVRTWNLPDQGIWEPRSEPVHHTHSRLLCWVALDRLLAMHRDGHLPLLREPARVSRERAAIRRDIETRAWSERLHSYVGVLDSEELDATVLLLSWYGFEDAGSARMQSTWQRLRAELATPYGLRRYRPARGWEEGAFGICGFWAVEHLARAGALDEARAWFERLKKTGNALGLFAEEADVATGAPLGNFPQAFTHIGLINAALTLEHVRARDVRRPSRTSQEVAP
jgi:GH15 family glucan-1,4-alpha-glucosidase